MSVSGVGSGSGVSPAATGKTDTQVQDYASVQLEPQGQGQVSVQGLSQNNSNSWRVDGQSAKPQAITQSEMNKIANKVAENFAGQMFKMTFDNQVKNQKFSLEDDS